MFWYPWTPVILLCYERINHQMGGDHQNKACVCQGTFSTPLWYPKEDLLLLFSGCIGAMCYHFIMLQSRVWEDFAEGIWISVGFTVTLLGSIGFYGQISWLTNGAHGHSAETGLRTFLDNMRRSLSPGSFPPSNIILRSFCSCFSSQWNSAWQPS